MDLDGRKVDVIHGDPCGCKVLDLVLYVGLPCRRIGHHVTKKRLAQIHYALWGRPNGKAKGK